jgi:predicted oxidoreductase
MQATKNQEAIIRTNEISLSPSQVENLTGRELEKPKTLVLKLSIDNLKCIRIGASFKETDEFETVYDHFNSMDPNSREASEKAYNTALQRASKPTFVAVLTHSGNLGYFDRMAHINTIAHYYGFQVMGGFPIRTRKSY